MKQYTSKDQTAKLIELGFPKPKSIESVDTEFESDSPHMDYDKIMEVYRDKFHLESEVDEYLKKMEV